LLESWALGIPCIVQELPCYTPYTDMTFKDANGLQNQLDKLFKDNKKYMKVVKQGIHTVDYGGKGAPKGWWLEKNLSQWNKLFTLPQKSINIDLTKINKRNNKVDNNSKLDLSI
jgi:hypothetical protein